MFNKTTLSIFTKDTSAVIEIASSQHLDRLVGVLSQSVFAEGKIVIGWNLKELFTFFKFHLPKCFFDEYKINKKVCSYCDFIDLKLCESFLSIKQTPPKTYGEALSRVRVIYNNESLLNINKSIYQPLITEVIPSIETSSIVNRETGREYCCYDIEGQVNGRLNIKIPDQNFYNPHNLSAEQKNLYSAGTGKKFIVFDYKHYEVSILAWLAKDFALTEIIKSGEDVYSKIWCIISGEESCSEEKRDIIKSVFLPIVYGSGINKISELTNYSIKASTFLVDAINKNFTRSFDWVKEHQEKLKTQDFVLDYFGRVLDFSEKSGRDAWSVRNAIIQAPAALICLEKLIQLYHKMYSSMDIIASIHDAFVCRIDCNKELWTGGGLVTNSNSVISCAKEILESPMPSTPGLILKVEASIGERWGTLKKIHINNKVDYNDD
jgi:hypothetical protein